MRAPALAYIGASGSGKSWLARAHVREDARVMYFDPMGSFDPGDPDNNWTSRTARASVAAILVERLNVYRLGVQAQDWTPEEMRTGLETILRAMERPPVQTVTGPRFMPSVAVVDELGLIAPRREPMPALERICRAGRHARLNVAARICSQRATDLNPTLRGLMDRLYVFRQNERIDQQALDQVAAGLGAKAAALPDRHYYVVERGTVTGPRTGI